MVTVKDIAWTAGFLEGEGTFGVAGTSPFIHCTQVQLEPLERLQAVFGGTIGNYENKSSLGVQRINRWGVYSQRAVELMMTLYPLMSPKRQTSIVKALDKWKARKPRKYHNALKTHCKRGHEFTPENTRAKRGGYRECRTCSALAKRAWNLKQSLEN